jgi:aminoglycoside phosphotransferase family enzyme/predicted kinase
MAGQDDVIAFLSDAASYGMPGARVERIETHISIVFLVGDRAFKLKRAIRLPYLDFSTPAARARFCRSELALNRRTAPALYLAVRGVTRAPDGRLGLDGDGTPEDWVLEMRRFSQDDLLDRLAETRRLTPALMRNLTDAIADFHAAAERAPDHGGKRDTADTIAGNHEALVAAGTALDRAQVDRLRETSLTRLDAIGPLLDQRRADGWVRRCHGDLHLRNICLLDGRPVPFDCIEFSDALACIDVLYDLAFLLMDLGHRGLGDLANLVLNRYLDITGDSTGLAALPLFMSVRAAVRAHVLATQARQRATAQPLDEARAYLALAIDGLRPATPRLIAVGGLSGTGKSTLARALAAGFAPAPGARVVRSDVLRKRLHGVMPETRLPPSAYGAETTARVYDGVHEQARAALAAGFSAIVDAACLRAAERRDIAALAQQAGARFTGLWLEAAPTVLAARIAARRDDASDADARVLDAQLRMDVGTVDWHRIDAGAGTAANLAAARALIGPTA